MRSFVDARAAALSPLLLFALCACGSGGTNASLKPLHSTSSDVTICPGGSISAGIDVSSYQATIDWAEVKDGGVQFAIAKATEGVTVQDSSFAANWAGMKSNGVIRGAYHFFHPQDDGAAQADDYLDMVGTLGEPGDLPPLLDFEYTDTLPDGGAFLSNAQVIAEAQKFIDEIKARTGLETIIYTYPYYWESLGSPAQFAQYPLWLANYTGATSNCPTALPPWTGWAIWQWAGDATSTSTPANPYAGVSGEDIDVFNGPIETLRAWATPPIAQASGNAALTAVNWPDQHVELFGRSTSGDLLHLATSGGNDSWTAPGALGSGVACGAAAAFWGAPGLYPELFSALPSGATSDVFWSGGSWNALQGFGGSGLAQLAAVAGMDGLLRVFALGSDGAIWINSWSQGSAAWSGWSSLGGAFATGVGAITWGNGTIELFATDGAGLLWHLWTESTSSSGWATWTQLGSGIASRPAAVRWSDGALGHAEVFARGVDGQLYHSEFSSSGGWPAPSVLSAGTSIVGAPSAFMNPAGAAQSGPEVLARDETGRVILLSRSGSRYGTFAPLGDQVAASDPFGWIRGDGAAEVFAIDGAGNLVRTLRGANGVFGPWSAIASGFDSCTAPLGDGDGGSEDAGEDGGSADAGSADAGNSDAGARDGGSASDAGAHDAGAGSDAGQLTPASSSGCSGGPGGVGALSGLLLALGTGRARRRVLAVSGAARARG